MNQTIGFVYGPIISDNWLYYIGISNWWYVYLKVEVYDRA